MISDKELKKLLLLCDKDQDYFLNLAQNEQIELKNYCLEIVKYGGTTHQLPASKVFTDTTLLKPARGLVKTLKRKKGGVRISFKQWKKLEITCCKRLKFLIKDISYFKGII